eukprot:5168862-Amphidinium_carterae.1
MKLMNTLITGLAWTGSVIFANCPEVWHRSGAMFSLFNSSCFHASAAAAVCSRWSSSQAGRMRISLGVRPLAPFPNFLQEHAEVLVDAGAGSHLNLVLLHSVDRIDAPAPKCVGMLGVSTLPVPRR